MTRRARGPVLYIFAGLPATGKSTLARRLARERGSVPARGPEGYLIAYAVAGENLSLGRDVVADSVNPLDITRKAWREVAARSGSRFVEIEVICSDTSEHRDRVEARSSDIPGLRVPTWADVVSREYEPWDRSHIVIDTSGRSVKQSFAALEQGLSQDRQAR